VVHQRGPTLTEPPFEKLFVCGREMLRTTPPRLAAYFIALARALAVMPLRTSELPAE
jgi:hypothetical protein